MALDLAALTEFNNEVAGTLIPKMVYTGTTMEYVTVKEGIKYKEPINLFEVDLDIQDGYGCVATPAGTASFSQRDIQVCQRTSFDGLCLKDLDKYYLGISALGAGSYNETFALAQDYSDLIVNQFRKSNENFVWGATTGAGDCVNGLKTIISGSTAGVVEATGAATGSFTSTAALGIIDSMIEQIPTDVADRDDLTVFMSVANFRKYVAGIRQANSYWFDPNAITNRGGLMDMVHPFTNVRVVGTVGLEGSARLVAGPARHIVVGTDTMSDLTEFQMWYDINSDQLKHRVVFKLGVNIAYPEFWVSNDLA
jgi:hypothetical protein